MSAPVVVGYTATDAGRDALTLGVRLAKALDTRLHLVIVLPNEGTRSPSVVPPERSYEQYLRGQAQDWLREAAELVPAEVTRSAHVRFAESFAEGIVAAGEEFGAGLLVVGAANGGRFGRHRLGSVASELLHSSTIPVALAPAGIAKTASADLPITRVTAALGTRPGAEFLLEEAARLATETDVPLRLVSLVTFDVPAGLNTGTLRLVGNVHAHDMLETVRRTLPADLEVEIEEAPGDSIEEAVKRLSWEPTELVLVGSSRLAQPRRLFLGSTAAKMLHELPVPMIVVPRERPEGA